MTDNIMDRRQNGKHKSSSNRQRFVRRVNKQVRDTIKENIKNGNIKDIMDDDNHGVVVQRKDISEPWFHHTKGGNTERVYPGNKKFISGDSIPKPNDNSEDGSGGNGGEDNFEFMISKKEYLDIFFEDLELPDMIKKQLSTISETKLKRSGFSVSGTPSKLNYIRSLKQSIGRRAALRNPKKKKIAELEAILNFLLSQEETPDIIKEIENTKKEIEKINRRIKSIPFIDEIDLRFNRFEIVKIPITRAVMFMLMDVSGSMDEFKKEMAKRFYILLYIFLSRTYDHIDIVPIRYHTEAKEVSESEFFNSKETGGTILSPALELSKKIINERYSDSWNIYFCHASDGDNTTSDTFDCLKLLDEILPLIQFFAYIQIGSEDNTLSNMYDDNYITADDNIDMAFIFGAEDIFPVFRKLFEKELS